MPPHLLQNPVGYLSSGFLLSSVTLIAGSSFAVSASICIICGWAVSAQASWSGPSSGWMLPPIFSLLAYVRQSPFYPWNSFPGRLLVCVGCFLVGIWGTDGALRFPPAESECYKVQHHTRWVSLRTFFFFNMHLSTRNVAIKRFSHDRHLTALVN